MQTSINMNEPAGVLVKTTLVDFPGLVACSFFLPGCNLRCPYCYNIDLATGNLPESPQTVSLNELFAHLEKRKNVLQGITISGGEALLSHSLSTIIRKARSLGYKIKLDTNGTLPERLFELISDSELCPDFIAMDIKTSPERYVELLPYSDAEKLSSKLIASIEILKTFPAEKREFRTVLVPGLIREKEILKIAEILPADASWQFAQFQGEVCLNSDFSNLLPYSDNEAEELVSKAKKIIKGANFR